MRGIYEIQSLTTYPYVIHSRSCLPIHAVAVATSKCSHGTESTGYDLQACPVLEIRSSTCATELFRFGA